MVETHSSPCKLVGELRSLSRGVLIVGAGISGIEAACFFSNSSIRVKVVERESRDRYLERSKLADRAMALEQRGVQFIFGVDGEQIAPHLSDVGLCVLSPGVSLESAIVAAVTRVNIPIISELELGITLRGGEFVAVTGSNGKSTTVSLIDAIMREGGINTFLCGNVGIPVMAGLTAENLNPEFRSDQVQIVEASSYQLETCQVIKPKIAVLLNISDNHLERHGTIERYLGCKARIFANQDKGDFAIINFDDPKVVTLSAKLPGSLLGFSTDANKLASRFGALVEYNPKQGIDRTVLKLASGEEQFDLSCSPLMGRHNRLNLAVAILACRLWGVSREAIFRAISTFQTLSHRLELLPAPSGTLVINDSKSTTVAASLAAFCAVKERYPDQRIALLLGGLAKAGSWEDLLTALSLNRERILPVVCFGRDARIIAGHCKAHQLECRTVAGVQEALSLGLQLSGVNGIVLFSPGCASFDQFRDFEQRGQFVREFLGAKPDSRIGV